MFYFIESYVFPLGKWGRKKNPFSSLIYVISVDHTLFGAWVAIFTVYFCIFNDRPPMLLQAPGDVERVKSFAIFRNIIINPIFW